MSSPGVYDQIVDRSFVTTGSGSISAGVVISAKRGPTELNVVTNARQFIDQYGLPDRNNPSMYAALRFLNRANFLTVYRVINDAALATGEFVRATETELEVSAANEGEWGNNITVKFNELTNAPDGVLGLQVLENDVVVEEFQVSRDVDAKNGFGRSIYIEDVVNNQSRFIRVTDIPNSETDYEEAEITLTEGADDSTAPSSAEITSAWEEFDNAESVDAIYLINAGWADVEVQQKMTAIAESRKNSVAILDVPQESSDDASAMVTYVQDELGLDTYFGAIYGGWLKVYDQYNDREVTIPPSGDVAAAHVQAITNGERWLSAFGTERGTLPNIIDTTLRMSEGQRTQLYNAGINPVTKIGSANAVIMGQKTLQVAESGLQRLNVVTNVLWINQSIANSLVPFIGRANTALNRDSANAQVSNFLESIQLRGGLTGFSVDTSEQINSQQDIDSGIFYIDIYLQPTRLMEEIRQRVIVTPTGVSLQ